MAINTGDLLEALKCENDSVENYLECNKSELINIDLRKMWNSFVKKSGYTKTDIIDRSNCGYNYFYCIISGRKIPSRDKIIELIIAMGLSVDDCQVALKYSGKAPLYPRIKRDSIIIFGINNSLSVYQISEILRRNSKKILRNSGELND